MEINYLKILWLIPLYVSTRQIEISQRNFMLSEKNEIARSIRQIGHNIKTVINSKNQQGNMDGFSEVCIFRSKKMRWIDKMLYHVKMLNVALFDDYEVALFGAHSAHLIPFIKIGSMVRRRKPLLILDIRTVPVDLVKDLRSWLKLFRYQVSIKIADLFCDGLTCITPMLGATVKPKLKRLKKKIGYFQTGVNFDLFDPSKSFSLKSSLGLKNRFIVFYHGVISPNRGIQNVIRAIDICKERIPNILFMIVGTGNGESELKALTKELHLMENIMFTGGVPFEKIPSYIATADVGIIPLPAIDWWNVSSPIKLKEYLAMQLPVIATDIAAHRLVVEKTGGATLIKNHEPQNIAQAVSAFYESRKTTYPMKKRKELYGLISFNSQALRFMEYVDKL
jgi:glycosyltransferase involved in cell wall biosynthesis